MSIADISLWVLGILISILLAYWGILVSRKTVKKTSLCLLENLTISLLNQFKDKFSSVVVEYNKLPIEKNLVYFEFVILNDGTNDIDKSHIYKPLEIILPHEYKYIEGRINKMSSKDLACNIKIENNVLILDWDLLKSNEFFTIEVIVDSPQTISSLSNKITFNHRITHLNNITKFNLAHAPKNATIKQKKRYLAYSYLIGCVISMVFITSTIFVLNTNTSSKYLVSTKFYKRENGKEIELLANSHGIYILKENASKFDTATVKTINNKVITRHNIEKKGSIYIIIFFLFLFTFFLITFIRGTISDIRETMTDIKLLKLLEIIKMTAS